MRPTLRLATLLALALTVQPAHAQLMGPTWETNVVLTQADIEIIKTALATKIHGREQGIVATWANRTSGNSGSVTLQGISARDGRRCEQIEYRMVSAARPALADRFVLTSCIQPDGTWKLSAAAPSRASLASVDDRSPVRRQG